MRSARFRLALGLLILHTGSMAAQDQRNEQFYYPGSFNWQFLERYPEGGRLFNAFDYGHAVLYERLYTRPRDLKHELELRQFDYLTRDLLVRPPRFAVVEEAIEPAYAKLAWRAKLMFDWAHMLHRQIYDIYADPRLDRARQDSLIEKVTDYYLSNRRLAFAARPKTMALMDDQYYSQVFRRGYPKFNGLIWAYHWLQVGLYEPLIEGRSPAEKKAGVQAAIARFWSMVEAAPTRFPKVMPMTSAVAPRFSAAHPRAAVIFDNLHMTHDIISDILAADTVPAEQKRAVIYAALDRMQDSTREVMTMDEWQNMGEMMGGPAAMGGPATGLLPESDTASPASTPMAGMPGMEHHAMDHAMHAPPGEREAASGDSTGRVEPMMAHDMSGMAMPAMPQDSAPVGTMELVCKLHERMLRDPVMRRRMQADTTMRRMMQDLVAQLPPEQQARMHRLLMAPSDSATARPKSRRAPRATRPRPRADSIPAMDHGAMPGMTMPRDSTHPHR